MKNWRKVKHGGHITSGWCRICPFLYKTLYNLLLNDIWPWSGHGINSTRWSLEFFKKPFLKIPLNKHEYTLGVIKQLTTMHWQSVIQDTKQLNIIRRWVHIILKVLHLFQVVYIVQLPYKQLYKTRKNTPCIHIKKTQ